MLKHCYLYYVFHTYTADTLDSGEEIPSRKEIGVYSTRQNAQAAIGRFSNLPGFACYPDGFSINRMRCPLTRHDSKSTLRIVYRPYHERYLPDDDCDYVTYGNLYDTPEDAHAELTEWQSDPDFLWNADGACVCEYAIDEDMRLWSEGFTHEDDDGIA